MSVSFVALATANEFEFEFNYGDVDAEDNLQNSVALTLIRTQRDTATGLVILVFNLVYAPFKAMWYVLYDISILQKLCFICNF